MKKMILAALVCLGGLDARAAYFNTIVSDPAHPKISAKLLYTSKFALDGGLSDVALVYHKADPADCLWPKKLLDLGFPPVSWTLLEAGAGGNRETAFTHLGVSVNFAPTLLGPLINALDKIGGKAEALGMLLVSPDGSGLSLGLGWKANVVQNGGVVPFDHLRFPPRYSMGYVYQF